MKGFTKGKGKGKKFIPTSKKKIALKKHDLVKSTTITDVSKYKGKNCPFCKGKGTVSTGGECSACQGTGSNATRIKHDEELKNSRNEVSFALSKSGKVIGQSHDEKSRWAEHGFDLTDFEPNGFQEVLKSVGIPISDGEIITKDYGGKVGVVNYGFLWEKDGLAIVTGNNPITGEYNRGDQAREPEKDYASYIGISGKDKDEVEKVAQTIKQLSGNKDESVGSRDFI